MPSARVVSSVAVVVFLLAAAMLAACVGDSGGPPADAGADAPDVVQPSEAGADADADADAGAPAIVDVCAGDGLACAVRADGSLWCWGVEAQFEPDAGISPSAIRVSSIDDVKTVDCSYSVCAVKNDGTVWCWGRNDASQLGHTGGDAVCGTLPCNGTPSQVPGLSNAEQISVGALYACARTSTGDVYCWGSNNAEQLGVSASSTPSTPTPQKIALPMPATQIATGLFFQSPHACAVLSDATVWCWGSDSDGELGSTSSPTDTCTPGACSASPFRVETSPGTALANVQKVIVLPFASCALRGDYTVWCWGSNGWGQLGMNEDGGVQSGMHPPAKVQALGTTLVKDLAGRYVVAAVVDSSGKVWTWGRADYGDLGNGATSGAACGSETCQLVPQPLAVSNVTRVATGLGFNVALTTNGQLWAWGNNEAGQIGHAPATSGDQNCGGTPCQPTPTPIAF